MKMDFDKKKNNLIFFFNDDDKSEQHWSTWVMKMTTMLQPSYRVISFPFLILSRVG